MPDIVTAKPVAARRTQPQRPLGRRARSRRVLARLEPLAWIGPAIILIGVVVIWPVVVMIQTSLQNITADGITLGSAGFSNYTNVLQNLNLPGILVRTVVWVAAVVGITMVLSLGMAQLFNQRFPGRRVARWAIIAPWAASVMMTSLIFRWMLDPNNGVINVFLHDIGVVHQFNSNQAAWLASPDSALAWMIAVAVFVSVPFTTYVLLAGLQTIPGELYEASRVDGASRWGIYRLITLPLLRPAFLIGLVINLMNVFNSFPIIWEMTQGGPGYETSTSTIFMYDLKQTFVGQSAAMSMINFLIVIVIVLAFIRLNRRNLQEAR
ncbi:MAG TPA: sugar ABC transporter permease [Streptosporangiaceae bacterium]|nr:sugar ABC transporter permease [Streptosporangiaceae bacterium]